MVRSTVALSFLLLAAGDAVAEGKFAPIPRGPIPPQPPCTCRGSDGREFQMGETICLRTTDGSRIARCVMVINNPSWEPTSTPCPQAAVPATPRRGA